MVSKSRPTDEKFFIHEHKIGVADAFKKAVQDSQMFDWGCLDSAGKMDTLPVRSKDNRVIVQNWFFCQREDGKIELFKRKESEGGEFRATKGVTFLRGISQKGSLQTNLNEWIGKKIAFGWEKNLFRGKGRFYTSIRQVGLGFNVRNTTLYIGGVFVVTLPIECRVLGLLDSQDLSIGIIEPGELHEKASRYMLLEDAEMDRAMIQALVNNDQIVRIGQCVLSATGRFSDDVVEGKEYSFVRQKKVFVSYSSKDTGIAKNFSKELERRGFFCFLYEKENYVVGDDYQEVIDSNLRDSDSFVVLLSNNVIHENIIGASGVEHECQQSLQRKSEYSNYSVVPVACQGFERHGIKEAKEPFGTLAKGKISLIDNIDDVIDRL